MLKNALVKDWMTPQVVTVAPNTSLPEADQLMVHHKIRRLPVLKDGCLVGIITRSNLWGATGEKVVSLNIYDQIYQISQMTVARVMTLNPITVSPETTLGEATALMLQHKISGLPVVEADLRVVGIITESDLFRIMAKEWGYPQVAYDLAAYDVISTS